MPKTNLVVKLHSQVVGNVGLYYVCYRLSLMGWNAMPTARNARGIDILAYSGDGKTKVSFQVKALSKRAPVPLGLGLENLIADWIVVLNGVSDFQKAPVCFVMNTPEVERLVHISGDDKHSHWLQPNKYDSDDFRERWDRIGRGDHHPGSSLPASQRLSTPKVQ